MKPAEALTRLQTLKRKHDLYKLLVDAANNGKRECSFSRDVRTKDEVKLIIYPGIDINELRKIWDELAGRARTYLLRLLKNLKKRGIIKHANSFKA